MYVYSIILMCMDSFINVYGFDIVRKNTKYK